MSGRLTESGQRVSDGSYPCPRCGGSGRATVNDGGIKCLTCYGRGTVRPHPAALGEPRPRFGELPTSRAESDPGPRRESGGADDA